MSKIEPQDELVITAQAMLAGSLSYLEGAMRLLRIRNQTPELALASRDFETFELISSETDALPFENDRHLWSTEALRKLEPDLKHAEIWAESVAREACKNLVKKYGRS